MALLVVRQYNMICPVMNLTTHHWSTFDLQLILSYHFSGTTTDSQVGSDDQNMLMANKTSQDG